MRSRRAYQTAAEEVAEAAYEARVPTVIVSPTGSGKTTIAMGIYLRFLRRGLTCMHMVHRDHLVAQTARQADEDGLQFGVLKAGHPERRADLQIASVHTLSRRKHWPAADVIGGDECHVRSIQAALQRPEYAGSLRLGFTATPEMQGGMTLHETFRLMHIAAQPSELLAQGFITNCRIWVPYDPDLSHVRILSGDYSEEDLEKVMATRAITGRVVEKWKQVANDKPTIVFTTQRAHSVQVRDEFRAAGVSAAIIDGEMGDEARAIILAQMATGRLKVLINVSIFCEGYDLPGLECVVLLRPTRSATAFLQMCGRGCRSAVGKSHYLLLDFAGNVLRHGPPHVDRPWTLEQARRDAMKRAGTAAQFKRCADCFHIWTGPSTCPQCGTSRLPKFVRYNDKEMVEVTDIAQDAGPALLTSAQQAKEAIDKYRRGLYAKYSKVPPSVRARKIAEKVADFAKTLKVGQ